MGKVADDDWLASFFPEVRTTHERIAERAEGMLGGRDDRLPLVGIPSGRPRSKGIRAMFPRQDEA